MGITTSFEMACRDGDLEKVKYQCQLGYKITQKCIDNSMLSHRFDILKILLDADEKMRKLPENIIHPKPELKFDYCIYSSIVSGNHENTKIILNIKTVKNFRLDNYCQNELFSQYNINSRKTLDFLKYLDSKNIHVKEIYYKCFSEALRLENKKDILELIDLGIDVHYCFNSNSLEIIKYGLELGGQLELLSKTQKLLLKIDSLENENNKLKALMERGNEYEAIEPEEGYVNPITV